MTNKQITRRLGIAERTVKAHLTNIFTRIDVTDRTQATLWAERNLPPGRAVETVGRSALARTARAGPTRPAGPAGPATGPGVPMVVDGRRRTESPSSPWSSTEVAVVDAVVDTPSSIVVPVVTEVVDASSSSSLVVVAPPATVVEGACVEPGPDWAEGPRLSSPLWSAPSCPRFAPWSSTSRSSTEVDAPCTVVEVAASSPWSSFVVVGSGWSTIDLSMPR